MDRMTTTLTAGALALACALPVCAAGYTIADIAPEKSMIVVGANDMTAVKAAFDRTGFKNIWDNKAIRDWATEALGSQMQDMKTDLENLGVDVDEFMVAPEGAMGVAVWFNDEPDAEEDGGMLFFADFGDKADGFEAQLKRIMDEGEDKGTHTVDQVDFGDTTIWTLEAVEDEDADEDDDAWEEEWNDDAWMDEGWDGGNADPFGMKSASIARMGNTMFVCSDLAQLERALEIVEDEAFGEGLAADADYRSAMTAIGDSHIYANIRAGELIESLAADFAMFAPLIEQVGLDAITGLSIGAQLDTDDAMLEGRYALLTSEKKGLVALFDNPPMRIAPPAFVNADAATFSAFQFNFSRLLPTVERALNAMPPAEAGQAIMMFEQLKMMMGPLFTSIGPEIYTVANITKPFGAESQKSILMIRASDEPAINQTIQSFGPMMGLGSRDFLGNTIWSPPAGGGMLGPMPSIGIGAGFLYMGDEEGVENAMRAVARGAGEGLAETPSFKNVAATLGNEAVAYGFTSTKQTMEYTEWTMKNMREIIEAQIMAQPGMQDLDPQWREDILKEAMADIPEFMQNMPSLDPITDNMGDAAFELHATDRGFEGRWMILRPGK